MIFVSLWANNWRSFCFLMSQFQCTNCIWVRCLKPSKTQCNLTVALTTSKVKLNVSFITSTVSTALYVHMFIKSLFVASFEKNQNISSGSIHLIILNFRSIFRAFCINYFLGFFNVASSLYYKCFSFWSFDRCLFKETKPRSFFITLHTENLIYLLYCTGNEIYLSKTAQ